MNLTFRFKRRKIVHTGKAKDIFEGPEPDTLVQHFKDEVGDESAAIMGKGVLNNRISEYLMTHLNGIGVPTHFIKRLNMREQLVRRLDIIPVEIRIHNVAAGDWAKRLGLGEGSSLPRSILEFYYKNPELGNPMVTDEHITAFGWAAQHELEEMMAMSLRVNDYLSGVFLGAGLRMIDCRLEFGRSYNQNGDMRIVLADEISPDTCHLWDSKTNEKMDQTRFTQNLGKTEEAYQTVARRLGVLV